MTQRYPVDPAAYMEFAQASTEVRDVAGFQALVRGPVRALLPHEMAYACIFRSTFDHIEIYRLVGIDFPEFHLAQAPMVFSRDERRIAHRWLETRRPVYVTPDAGDDLLSPRARMEIELLDLRLFAASGVLDLSANMGSYHAFYRLDPAMSSGQVEHLLELICPLLHQALARLPDTQIIQQHPLADLTPVERELLSWLAAGRTNREIAELRGRSQSTVRNQLEVLYRKLGANNRAEASRIAASAGLTVRAPATDAKD